jgi:hypothetical protein
MSRTARGGQAGAPDDRSTPESEPPHTAVQRKRPDPMFHLSAAQAFMSSQGIDAWLLYDYRGSNPLLWHILDGPRSTTRRLFLMIPQRGWPTFLAHPIDHARLSGLPFDLVAYRSWQEMRERLTALLHRHRRIALEYAPEGSIPAVSWETGEPSTSSDPGGWRSSPPPTCSRLRPPPGMIGPWRPTFRPARSWRRSRTRPSS